MSLKPEKPYGIVYIARNRVNGKPYVGKTRNNLNVRRSGHKSAAKSGAAGYGLFNHAIRQYGWDSFDWTILGSADTPQEFDVLEEHFAEVLGALAPSGYNMIPPGRRSPPAPLPATYKG